MYALIRAGCRIEFPTARVIRAGVEEEIGKVRASSRRSESARRRLDGPHRGSETTTKGGPPPRRYHPQPAPGTGHLPPGQCRRPRSSKTTVGSTRPSPVEPTCRWPSVIEGSAAQALVPSVPWPPLAPVAWSPLAWSPLAWSPVAWSPLAWPPLAPVAWPPLAPVTWSPLPAPVDGLPPLASGLIVALIPESSSAEIATRSGRLSSGRAQRLSARTASCIARQASASAASPARASSAAAR